eukprot:TRINITY_DN30517_c0_g1_i1.p1 TRINITY_DN30517_c0_g1~~TRINITY_DN30517_c0_g1_i1.p1  ORF type:complete len:406 (-),score=81.83 TRINITY_DN30517_c0_g1_i1:128-1285(-)
MGSVFACGMRDSSCCMCRDTFYDCEEGDSVHDLLFKRPIRQLTVHGALTITKAPCISKRTQLTDKSRHPGVHATNGHATASTNGVAGLAALAGGTLTAAKRPFPGGTIREHTGEDNPRALGSVRWSQGDGLGFKVRSLGNDGHRHLQKELSGGNLYDCISVDIVRADHRIRKIIGNHVEVTGEGGWCHALPRILCMNVQLPYRSGWPMMAHPSDDHGCSIVAFFRIRDETLELLRKPCAEQPPALRLLQDFVKGGATDLPNPGPRKSGLFKAIATCENVEEVAQGIPSVLKTQAMKQNGKPALITQSGAVFKDAANGEWMEISIDVRRFCFAAREALVQLRDRLRQASVHIGFLIQGVGMDLPEGIICDVRLHCLDIMNDPLDVA